MVRVTPREGSALRCSVCHDTPEACAPCPACRTLFHVDCRLWLGRCSTLGCRGPLPLVIRVTLSRRRRRLARAIVALALPGIFLGAGLVAGVLIEARKFGGGDAYGPEPLRFCAGVPAPSDFVREEILHGPTLRQPAELVWFEVWAPGAVWRSRTRDLADTVFYADGSN